MGNIWVIWEWKTTMWYRFLYPFLQPMKRNIQSCIYSSSYRTDTCKKINLNVLIFNPCRSFAIKGPSSTETKVNSKTDRLKSLLISELNFETEEDAKHFTKLPLNTLIHIHTVTKNDRTKGYCRNRLYYIAEKLQCPSSVLSLKLSQRTFIYSLSFNWLEDSLKVLLEYEVPTNRILRDLWVLKYHHKTIRERLQRVRDAGIDVLYPWMVRCSEDILQRFINLTNETKDILKEVKSTQLYLANRLNISPEYVEDICYKIPALKTIRVTKVKSFLDFLEKEGFEVDDIANKPRVLTASQKTVEQRLQKLRQFGLSYINLNVLCRSRKDFNRYLESLESATEINENSDT